MERSFNIVELDEIRNNLEYGLQALNAIQEAMAGSGDTPYSDAIFFVWIGLYNECERLDKLLDGKGGAVQ